MTPLAFISFFVVGVSAQAFLGRKTPDPPRPRTLGPPPPDPSGTSGPGRRPGECGPMDNESLLVFLVRAIYRSVVSVLLSAVPVNESFSFYWPTKLS